MREKIIFNCSKYHNTHDFFSILRYIAHQGIVRILCLITQRGGSDVTAGVVADERDIGAVAGGQHRAEGDGRGFGEDGAPDFPRQAWWWAAGQHGIQPSDLVRVTRWRRKRSGKHKLQI